MKAKPENSRVASSGNVAVYLKDSPVGSWCQNDVVSTSMRRDHVASTLIRRHFHTKCPLGRLCATFTLLEVFANSQFSLSYIHHGVSVRVLS